MKRRFIGVALIGLSLFAMMLTFAFRKGAKDSEEAEFSGQNALEIYNVCGAGAQRLK